MRGALSIRIGVLGAASALLFAGAVARGHAGLSRANAPGASAQAAVRAGACALIAEREAHPFASVVRYALGGLRNPAAVRFKAEADLNDVVQCAEDPSIRRIVWILHAQESPQSGGVNLVYFARVPESGYAEARAAYERGVRERLRELEASPIDAFEMRGDTASPAAREIAALQSTERALRADPRAPIYLPPQAVLDGFFKRLARALAGRPTPLERLSILACRRESMRPRYPSFAQVEALTDARLAPTSSFGSALRGGADVSALDPAWIRRELED